VPDLTTLAVVMPLALSSEICLDALPLELNEFTCRYRASFAGGGVAGLDSGFGVALAGGAAASTVVVVVDGVDEGAGTTGSGLLRSVPGYDTSPGAVVVGGGIGADEFASAVVAVAVGVA